MLHSSIKKSLVIQIQEKAYQQKRSISTQFELSRICLLLRFDQSNEMLQRGHSAQYESAQIQLDIFTLQAYLRPNKLGVCYNLRMSNHHSLRYAFSYSFCTSEMLTAQAQLKIFKGVAFVVDHNYLIRSASNCYSQENGEYSNTRFLINPSRIFYSIFEQYWRNNWAEENQQFFVINSSSFAINLIFLKNILLFQLMEGHQAPLMSAYKTSNQCPLLDKCDFQNQVPLTFQDSINRIPNYPFCTLGVLTARGDWGTKKGIAFVVDDNYLFTCASNCYSHQHGKYPSIHFTITSNRKNGYDTYKVSKVFIPDQFKKLSQETRKQYNYALIFIQASISLTDEYGNIRLFRVYGKSFILTYLKCHLNNQGQLQFIGEHFLYESLQICLSGSPIIQQSTWQAVDRNVIYAMGLIVQESTDQRPYLLKFTESMKSQLQSWVTEQVNSITMNSIKYNAFNSIQLQKFEKTSIKWIRISNCQFNQFLYTSFIQNLPITSVQILQIWFNKYPLQLAFLKQIKFEGLTVLQLCHCKIGPQGCKNISQASMQYLRYIDLGDNPLKAKGLEHLALGKWRFLRRLLLTCCDVDDEGMQFLCQSRWPNLNYLDFNIMSKIGRQALTLGISHKGLSFLKQIPWGSLQWLILNGNPIGNKGCKLIKQSGLILHLLFLQGCLFDEVGVKWLCKQNLNKMISLNIGENKFGDKGCYQLSKAYLLIFKQLYLIFLSD